MLIARAWITSTPAITRIHAYPATDTEGPTPDVYGSTAPATIGGAVRGGFVPSSGRYQWSTAHQPGNSDQHVFLVANNYVIDHVSMGNSIVGGLAAVDTNSDPVPTGFVEFVYGGFGTPQAGPLRLLQNDWFSSDFDGDGLGTLLEADLGTCDNPTDVLPNGETCLHRFPECTSPSSPTCLAQLRDTDHDGLRDDVEVYGYDHSTSHMARYGADPLHQDVFIEMHTTDRDTTVGAPGCDGFAVGGPASRDPRFLGGETVGPNFFDRVDAIYSQADLPSSDMNPDGTEGIRIHFDVGVPNPDPTDTAWGDWGAGNNCYATTNTYKADCAADLHPDRGWLFRFAVDGPGIGQTANSFNCYRASDTATHVHEIGHVLGLHHGGPILSAGAGDNGANRRPTYPSRINYRFEKIDGPNAWEELTFSDGAIPGAPNSRTADETNPFPSASNENIAALRLGIPGVPVWSDTTGGVLDRDVDWNLSSTIDTGPTIWSAYRGEENSVNAREWAGKKTDPDLTTAMYGTHMDAAVVGDVLTLAYVKYDDGPGTGRVYLKANSDGDCDLGATQMGDHSTYGPCIELGTPYAPGLNADAVSIAPTLLPAPSGGGTVEGLLLVYRNDTKLYWVTFYVTPNTSAQQATFQAQWFGTLSGFTVDADGEVGVTLVEVPASSTNPHGGVLLIYEDAAGVVRQGYLPAASTTWQGPTAAQLPSGNSFGAFGDVGAVAHEGIVYLGAHTSNFDGIRLYSLPSGSNANTQWTYITEVPSTKGSLFPPPGTYGRALDVELAVRPALPLGQTDDEFFVFFRNNTNQLEQTRTDDMATWAAASWNAPNSIAIEAGEESQVGTVTVFDDRAVAAGAHGLRSYRSTSRRCDTIGTACTSPGYSPGVPDDPTDLQCGTEHCFSWSMDCNGGGCFSPSCTSSSQCNVGPCLWGFCRDDGKRPSHVAISPFAEGHHPTNYCDYNDWVQMHWAGCQYLTRQPASTLTSDFVTTPYQLTPSPNDTANVRCDIRPSHPEPDGNGSCVFVMPIGNMTESDRTLNPGAYLTPDDDITCDF